MESAKLSGKKISRKELEKYGQVKVTLRSNKLISSSLIQDGRKLMPIKMTQAKSIAAYGLQDERSSMNAIIPKYGGNSSRLVVRDNPSGTTEFIIKTPARPKMAPLKSLGNAKATSSVNNKKIKSTTIGDEAAASRNESPLGLLQS